MRSFQNSWNTCGFPIDELSLRYNAYVIIPPVDSDFLYFPIRADPFY